MNRKTLLLEVIIGCCILFIAPQYMYAQHFTGEGRIDSVTADGFFYIELSPAVNCYLKDDFSDVRIYDESGKEAPFLLQTETPIHSTTHFKEYEIIKKEIIPRCCTRLIIHNPGRNKMDNISLIIKNADVTKEIKLSGGDDTTNWFALKDKIIFHSVINHSGTSELKILNFPPSDYAYFKIEVNDSFNPPLNFLKAGNYDTYSEYGIYTQVPLPSLSQVDSAGTRESYVNIYFGHSQYIDKIEFEIEGPPYYLRQSRLGVVKERQRRNKKIEQYFQPILDVDLGSNVRNVIYLSNYRAEKLYLIIQNADDLPLKVKAAGAYQLKRYLVAYLKQGSRYLLRFGNPEINSPVYDLRHFRDSIPSGLQVLRVSDIKIAEAGVPISSRSFFTSKIFIWAAIGLVVLLLGIMSVKMVREMGSKNS